GGGVALNMAADTDYLLPTFAGLFVVAMLCRLISVGFLIRQTEPEPPGDQHRTVRLREMLSRLRHTADGKFLAYLFAVQLAVQICGPYFNPYIKEKLEFSYLSYALLI